MIHPEANASVIRARRSLIARVFRFWRLPVALLVVHSCTPATDTSRSAGADVPLWRLAEEPTVTIGVVEGDEWYQLHDVRGAIELSDGRIVIAEEDRLRVYSATGEYLADWGGPGNGPGEFAHVSSIWPYIGDSLAVDEYAYGRISIFAESGEFGRRMTRNPIPDRVPGESYTGLRCCRVAGVFTDGSFLIRGPERIRPSGNAVEWSELLLLRLLATGGGMDTVMTVRASPKRAEGDRPRFVDLYFGPHISFVLTRDRLYTGSGETLEVQSWSSTAEGMPGFTILGEVMPVPEAMKSTLEQNLRNSGRDPPLASWYAATLPTYQDLLADGAGRIWVREFQWLVGREGHVRYQVFESGGTLVARAEVPVLFQIHWIGEDRIIGLTRDDVGVQYVKVFALVEAGEQDESS